MSQTVLNALSSIGPLHLMTDRFAEANGSVIPEAPDRLYTDLEPGSGACRAVAEELLVEHAHQLVSYGARALHVYALNKWELPLALAQDING